MLEGLEAVNKALEIKPDYIEAMTYKGLLLRTQALVEKDPKLQQQLIREGTELGDKANEMRKARAGEIDAVATTRRAIDRSIENGPVAHCAHRPFFLLPARHPRVIISLSVSGDPINEDCLSICLVRDCGVRACGTRRCAGHHRLNGRQGSERAAGRRVAGASVIAIHLPSGTTYEATTRADGRFTIIGMRVGGPYSVTVAYTGGGAAAFAPETQENIEVMLGVATDLVFNVKEIAVTETVTVTAQSDAVFASNRTGAATAVDAPGDGDCCRRSATASRSSSRLTPAMGGNMSFAGQDNRMNNITVDGSYFNNSFGLGNQPGDRTGVAPISMDAIEQIQVNVAPFDVRSGNFVGAGVNTRDPQRHQHFRGSGFYQWRDRGPGRHRSQGPAGESRHVQVHQLRRLGGGPIVKNRLFFFGNAEKEETEQPGTTFRANSGGEAAAGSVTRVLASDLDDAQRVPAAALQLHTGPYQDYSHLTPGRRLLAKFDYNLNNRNKLSFRYNQLDSDTDVLLSNSSSLGFGTRRGNTTGLNFQDSNYQILENSKSGVGELNTVIGTTMSNSLIVGYNDSRREPLDARRHLLPVRRHPQRGTVYTSFGYEPFTPNNELRYKNSSCRTTSRDSATGTRSPAGFSFERYKSENVFFPGAQSVYVYNSLQDFYDDVNRVRPVTSAPLPGPLQQHSRPGEADPAAGGRPTPAPTCRTSGRSATNSR